MVCDVSETLHEQMDEGRQFLFEGAQGSMLDIDHGTYPYVTSSNTVAGSACAGAGVGPEKLNYVLGITKAYCTRVGEGPFPTELLDETGELLRRKGNEFGAVTGRPRRCGWLDTAVVKYAAMLNSLDYLAITRLDILDDLDTIKICTGYKYKGQQLKEYPASLDVLENVEPIYEDMPGWKTSISNCKSYDELPEAARHYVERISELVGVPLGIVSVGPNRSQTIILKTIF